MKVNARTISLSKYLGVTRQILERAGVFDATLGIDTKLFVDPKLLTSTKLSEFGGSREKILKYFDILLRVHKQSVKIVRLRKIARDMIAVPEPVGLSIGYGNKSDNGTSIPKNIAANILLSASELVAVGIEDKEIFELLGLFVEGFGPDSISDLTIHIIYDYLCLYTQSICKSLGIKTTLFTINGHKYGLPTHPFKKKQLIFIPHSLLRPLPVASSWEEISEAAAKNKKIRDDFNRIIRPVFLREIEKSKSTKSKLNAAQNKDAFLKLIDIYRNINVDSYDLTKDVKGYYDIQPFVDNSYTAEANVHQPKDLVSLIDSVRQIVFQFKKSIELNGANKLLYHKTITGVPMEDRPHREDVAQIIFYLISDVECQNRGIFLAREPNAGLGPVDFSLGQTHLGNVEKVLVEIKKSDNTSLFDGFNKQVAKYQESENADYSYFVVIRVRRENPRRQSQLKQVTVEFEKRKSQGQEYPELIIVDGIIHPTPSKL